MNIALPGVQGLNTPFPIDIALRWSAKMLEKPHSNVQNSLGSNLGYLR